MQSTNKIKNVRELLHRVKADAIVVKSYENRLYLTELKTSAATVIVTKKGQYFLCDERYEEIAKRELSSMGFTVVVGSLRNMTKNINDIMQNDRVSIMLLESDAISHEEYLEFETALWAKTLPLKTQLKKLRMIKEDSEIENLKTAQRINERCFEEIIKIITPGMTEKEIEARLVYLMLENGSDLDKFHICCISGENSSLIHGRASERILRDGDVLLLEFGAVYNGYRSNMARTVCIGYASDEFKKAYEVVKNSFIIAMQQINSEKSAKKIDDEVRTYIEKSGYHGCFNHSLGHGIGIDLNEMPLLNPNSNDEIQAGNVLAIEPGIYIKEKFGIRICDMIYLSNNSIENLTRATKDLIIL